MATVKERINQMDDFQVVRFFQFFGQNVFEGATVSLDEVKDGIPASTRKLPDFNQLENLKPEQTERLLDPAQSAAVARSILLNLADDSRFGPLIEAALDSYKDDEMVAEVVLAVGFAVSLVLIAATTELDGKVFGIKLKKGQATAEMIKSITEPISKVLSDFFKN